jgi:hypothetical protein
MSAFSFDLFRGASAETGLGANIAAPAIVEMARNLLRDHVDGTQTPFRESNNELGFNF